MSTSTAPRPRNPRSKASWWSPAFLEMCLDAGRPVALSSDAHRPEQLGRDYERAVELLDGLGVRQLAVFDRRKPRMAELG